MPGTPKLAVRRLHVFYGRRHALKGVSLEAAPNTVLALIGPPGCGKSALLKTFNRMNDLPDNARIDGMVLLDGQDIYHPAVDVTALRRRVGMLFAQPTPFPMSIYDNIAYGPKLHGRPGRRELDGIVEQSLRGAALWEEVKDRLKASALGLSGGQQQRLCVARLLAVGADTLLMDDPCAALDPAAASKIEELISELKNTHTVVIATRDARQAARVAERTAFFLDGELIECQDTKLLFMQPSDRRTEDYLSGRLG